MAPRKCEPGCTCYKHSVEWKEKCRERALAQVANEPAGYRSQRMKDIWAKRSPEERVALTKKAITNARKAYYKPDVVKARAEGIKKAWESKTAEQRLERMMPALKNRGVKMSLPEINIAAALEFMGIDFIREQCLLDKYFVDFTIDNVILEVDGEYWHDVDKDTKRDSDLVAAGYIVIRIPEKEIKENAIGALTKHLLHGLKRGV